jgi:hypothetical protein
MNIRQHFVQIKRLFFPRWDRQDLWRVSTTSKRHIHGRCDPELRVIEIVIQHADHDERDRLIIHEICHAVAHTSHGKKWQDRMEKAAKRADALGRQRLAQLRRDQIVAYQQSPVSLEGIYNQIRDALADCPEATFPQIKRWLANEYGLLVSEVCKTFRRAEKVFQEAKRDAQEERALQEAWLRSRSQPDTHDPQAIK